MELEAVRKLLEKKGRDDNKNAATSSSSFSSTAIESMPHRFFERFVVEGLVVHLIESGRLVCSLKLPQRLLNNGNFLHGGATAMLVDLVGAAVIHTESLQPSVSVEINISFLEAAYLDEEIEIEAKNLRVGKAIAVASVEFRKKTTGKIIAQGRHTKYFTPASKM